MEFFKSFWSLIKNSWGFFVVSFFTIILGSVSLFERFLDSKVPDVILIIIGVIIFLYAVTREYHRLRMQYAAITNKGKLDDTDWINSYYEENKSFPPLPKSLTGFVDDYKGEPISENLKLKNPSMQSLRRLTWGDRRKLIGLIRFLGSEPKDYLSKAAQYASPGGDAKRLEKELFEYYGLD
jgi:hypothetical protein